MSPESRGGIPGMALVGSKMSSDERTAGARKVLVTGQADQADTVRAVNNAGLDHYIAKP